MDILIAVKIPGFLIILGKATKPKTKIRSEKALNKPSPRMCLAVVTYARQYLKLIKDLPVQLKCQICHTKHSGKEPPLFMGPEVLYYLQ